ncbi:MAG: hypothetical protein AMXMBFR34_14780 [Myxococcaceae bacterium]
MLNRMLFLTVVAGIALSSTGCATMVASRTSPYQIVSDIPGAEVRVNGMPVGRTPTVVEIDRKHPQRIEVSAPGRYAQTCWPRTSVGMGYVVADTALCLLLFPFGCIAYIDASGAWNDLDDNICSVSLQPSGEPVAAVPASPQLLARDLYPPPPPPPLPQ